MSADERITLWLAQLRAAGRTVLLARLVIALTGAIALVVSAVQPWDQMDLVPYVGVPLLLAAVVLPDSLAAMLFMLVIALGWLMRAPTTVSWGLVLTAAALVILHLSTAFAAQLPSYARVHRTALHRWWLPAATATVLAPLIAGAAALVHHANVPGSLAVTAAAITLTALTIWLTTGQKLSRD
ncbi:hypothetical protein JOF29_006403 [Kribbella aluminosa]|uniref:Uncharacterized protein n=1 Tax=Kribbella aluminosa TaxID=416017 RepID=A0ABS4UUI8_9ACTN|nr:hypothetical protein [Kribbella aluminosa]MBP2355293.1 hypothetical protein [Kribbella aluminosa]